MKLKNVKNEAKLTFLSRSCNEAFARTVTAAFAVTLDPTIDEIADLKTAVSEAVTNCIVHAYEDIGPVTLRLEQIGDDRIRVTVKDKGCGIEDVPKAMEPAFTTGKGERSGLGFSVMRAFTDKLTVRSKPGRGTTVVMLKRIARRTVADT